MPWYVTVLGFAGPLVWALYLLWRVERQKRSTDAAVKNWKDCERVIADKSLQIANMTRDAENHESVLGYLKGQLSECEGSLDAATSKPGSLREHWRERLRAMQAPTGKTDPK